MNITDKQTRNLWSLDVFRRAEFFGVGIGLFSESLRRIPKGTAFMPGRAETDTGTAAYS